MRGDAPEDQKPRGSPHDSRRTRHNKKRKPNKMAKEEKLLDRIGTINANSVTDKEFEDVWGVTLDACVNQLMDYWNARVSETRDAIGVTNK